MAKKKSTKKGKVIKISKEFNPPILLIIIVAVAIVLALFVWRDNKKKEVGVVKNDSQEEIALSPKSDYPMDTENDGVYANYKYGFSFKYPKDVFTYQYPDTYNISWFNEPLSGGLPPTAYSKNAVSLGVIVRDVTPNGENDADGKSYREQYINRFNELSKIENGQKDPWGATKLSESKTNNYSKITLFYETPSDKESEYTGAYYAMRILKDNLPVIDITFDANNKALLQKHKKEFDSIVSSFAFTN